MSIIRKIDNLEKQIGSLKWFVITFIWAWTIQVDTWIICEMINIDYTWPICLGMSIVAVPITLYVWNMVNTTTQKVGEIHD